MNKPLILLLLSLPCLSAGCGAVKTMNKGMKWTYKQTTGAVGGAGRVVAGGAKKLWPWGKPKDKAIAEAAAGNAAVPGAAPGTPTAATPAATGAPAAVASAAAAAPGAPPVGAPAPEKPFVMPPKSKLSVTDADLGPDKRIEENAKLTLNEGWEVEGARLLYTSDFGGGAPKLLRVEGSPCRASKEENGVAFRAQAREMHYRQDTGVLTLKGFPAVQIGLRKVAAAAGSTVISLHLESGSFKVDGPASTSGN